MSKAVKVFFILSILMPAVSLAQSVVGEIVPCGQPGNMCQECHLVDLAQNIITWLIGFLSILAVIVLVVAGFKLVTSAGNVQAKESAKQMATNVVIGIIIVLSAWLVVDTLMKAVLPDGETKLGPWNDIICSNPDFMNPTPGQSRGTASGLSVGTIDRDRVSSLARSAEEYETIICEAAAKNGIPGECSSITALMMVESSGCRQKVSPAKAYGCMQILPSTAKLYDPERLGDMTQQQIADLLVEDDQYSLELGTKIYADLYQEYDADRERIYAAYNGGKGANNQSVNCSGNTMRWQCEWDGEDCLDGVGSDCRPNAGPESYEETRNYVRNVTAIEEEIGRNSEEAQGEFE